VATLVHRVYDVADLADELQSPQLFYSNGMEPAGERCIVESGLVNQTRGRMVLGCAGWVADEWRGKKLFGPLVLAGKALSLYLWKPDWWFGLAEVDTLRQGNRLKEQRP
jgi:hypothetical protein